MRPFVALISILMPVPDSESPVLRAGSPLRGLLQAAMVFFPMLGATTGCIWRLDALAPFTLIPPWCWLPAGVVSILVRWRNGGRKGAIGLAWLWCLFAVFYVEELPALARELRGTTGEQAVRGETIRVVSFNCAADARGVRDLQRARPDVVLLQEAPGEDQLREMARELWGDQGGALAGGDTAILARGTIEPGFVDRAGFYVSGRVLLGGRLELDCVSLRLSPPVARLDFWSGGFWRAHRAQRNKHRRELEELAERLRSERSSRPLVVGGDFNTTPLDPALDALTSHLSDAFRRAGRGWGATGTNNWPLFRVDQVWTDARTTVMSVRARKSVSSDHRMVVCEIIVRER